MKIFLSYIITRVICIDTNLDFYPQFQVDTSVFDMCHSAKRFLASIKTAINYYTLMITNYFQMKEIQPCATFIYS